MKNCQQMRKHLKNEKMIETPAGHQQGNRAIPSTSSRTRSSSRRTRILNTLTHWRQISRPQVYTHETSRMTRNTEYGTQTPTYHSIGDLCLALSGLQERPLMLNIPKNVDSLSTGFAPMPGDVRASRGGRLVAECRDETICLRPNVLTGHKASPDPTRHESKTLPRGTTANTSTNVQPTRNVRQTDATKSHCCRTTKSAPIGTPLRPWRAQIRQQQRHLHVTSNISDAARCLRACCRSAKVV